MEREQYKYFQKWQGLGLDKEGLGNSSQVNLSFATKLLCRKFYQTFPLPMIYSRHLSNK